MSKIFTKIEKKMAIDIGEFTIDIS